MSTSENYIGNPITEGVIWKQLLKFFFPIMIGTFFQQLYNTADAIIVGQFLGKEALAATGGATGVLINLVVMFFINLSSGASVVLSQFYGARRPKEVSNTVHTAMAMAIVGGFIMMIIGIVTAPAILRVLNSPADIFPLAVTYIRYYFSGMIAVLIYNIGSAILRAVGDSKRPLYFLIVSCFVNIVLDLLLVAVIPMGIAGAAIATVIAQIISAVLVIRCLMKTDDCYKLYLNNIRFHPGLLKRIVLIGLPAGIQGSMFSISNLLIQSTMNGFGTDLIAAWTAFLRIDAVFWMGSNAFGVAVLTFSGQNYGAGEFDRIKRCCNISLCIYTVFSAVISSAMLLFGRYFLMMFTSDAGVLDYGMLLIYTISPFYITYMFVEIYSNAIRGTGHTLFPMILTCFGICVFRILWIFIYIPSHRTVPDLALSYPISWLFTSVLFVIYYYWGKWLKH